MVTAYNLDQPVYKPVTCHPLAPGGPNQQGFVLADVTERHRLRRRDFVLFGHPFKYRVGKRQ